MISVNVSETYGYDGMLIGAQSIVISMEGEPHVEDLLANLKDTIQRMDVPWYREEKDEAYQDIQWYLERAKQIIGTGHCHNLFPLKSADEFDLVCQKFDDALLAIGYLMPEDADMTEFQPRAIEEIEKLEALLANKNVW